MEAPVSSKKEIIERLGRHHTDLHKLGVKRLGLFGSFVHGAHHDDSDVDVLVDFRPGQKTFDHFMQLSFFLEQVLKRRIEIVTTESLSPYIGPHILQDVEYVEILS